MILCSWDVVDVPKTCNC